MGPVDEGSAVGGVGPGGGEFRVSQAKPESRPQCWTGCLPRATPRRDVTATGFDDSPAAGTLSRGLTSVGQLLEAIGREDIRKAMVRLAALDVPPERVLLALFARDSTYVPTAGDLPSSGPFRATGTRTVTRHAAATSS